MNNKRKKPPYRSLKRIKEFQNWFGKVRSQANKRGKDVSGNYLATLIGVANGTFSKMLNGQGNFSEDDIDKLCKHLSIDHEKEYFFYLIGWCKDNPKIKHPKILDKIRILLDKPKANRVKEAISRFIKSRHREDKNTPEEIARFIISWHSEKEDKAVSNTINEFLALVVKEFDIRSDPEPIESKKLFNDLLGWLVHIALEDVDLSKHALPSGVVDLPVSIKVTVEICSAKLLDRPASLKEGTSLDNSVGEGAHLHEISTENATTKVSEILVSLYQSMEPTWVPNYREGESYGLSPTELDSLQGMITAKKGSEEIYPYIMLEMLPSSEDHSLAVGEVLCQLVPDLHVVTFGTANEDSTFGVDGTLRASIKEFYEALEKTFPDKNS